MSTAGAGGVWGTECWVGETASELPRVLGGSCLGGPLQLEGGARVPATAGGPEPAPAHSRVPGGRGSASAERTWLALEVQKLLLAAGRALALHCRSSVPWPPRTGVSSRPPSRPRRCPAALPCGLPPAPLDAPSLGRLLLLAVSRKMLFWT